MRRLVALALPAGERFVEELRRAFDGGDAVLPLDPRLPPAAVRRLIEVLSPAVLVTGGTGGGFGGEGSGEGGGGSGGGGGGGGSGESVERVELAGGVPVEEGDALVVATSGTTGEPKGVLLTHAAVAASAFATSSRLGVDPARDRWLACLPLAHVGGLSVVTRALVTGTPLEVHAGFDAGAVAEAARARGATLVSLVATALGRLGAGDASRFRAILLGGAAPPADLPPNVVTTYGMTETGSGVVYDGWPLDGVELRIGAGGARRPGGGGEGCTRLGIENVRKTRTASPEGEVHVRCPMLLRAYRDGTDPCDAEGWFATGDAGSLDADGRLTLLGRLSDLVISGGENVWPVAVEEVLRRHPGVGDVAVAGRPDPEWGERVVAVVVPAGAGAEGPPALEELRALVKAEIGPWAAPRELVLSDALPRGPGGKVQRRRLLQGR